MRFRSCAPLFALSGALSLPLLAISSISSVTACGSPAPGPVPPLTTAQVPSTSVSAEPPAAVGSSLEGVDVASLEKSVAPCNDFYEFACGGWLKATPIPDDEAAWMRSFHGIDQKNELLLKEILVRLSEGRMQGETYGKALGDFYASCTDEGAIEKAGVAPLKEHLAQIEKVKDAASLTQAITYLHAQGVGALFNASADIDVKNTTQVIFALSQGGLGLPERDYYVSDDAKKKELRAAYEKHVAAMLVLVGDKPADAKESAAAILRIETDLAKASMTNVELREPKKLYNRLELKGTKEAAPAFGWDDYLARRNLKGVTQINVAQPEFLKKMGAMVKSVPMKEWRAYLRWHLVRETATSLSSRFMEEKFAFKKLLTGAKAEPPRWKRCVRAVDGAMGEALGEAFVKTTLGAEGKADVLSMVHAIEEAMKKNLDGLAWMDADTKKKAFEKLAKIRNKIGYPDKLRNYDALAVTRTSYFENVLRASAFEEARHLAKIGKPVDRNEWQMSAPTVNAYYEPPLNEMVFPAGILQPPMYSTKMSPAANFGAIGMVIGHELTHGFDDEGSQYDADGNLVEWWTKSVSEEFSHRTSCVEKQYDDYVVEGDLHVKGKLTLGENIADLGGLKLAYAAYKSRFASAPSISGFTADQQFFISYAQGWCTNMRPEALRTMIATNPHSPAKLRVNGPLSNLSEFSTAFSCKEGSPMVRAKEKRCAVW